MADKKQVYYIGMYRDYGECKLDIDCASTDRDEAITRFYQDYYGDYANLEDTDVDEREDALNQDECDIVIIDASVIGQISELK